jgi:hypothetical protein
VVIGWVDSVSVLVGPAVAGLMIRVDGPGAALALFAVAMLAGTVLVAPFSGAAGLAAGEDDLADTGAGDVLTALRRDPGVAVLLGLIGVQYIAIGALDVVEVVLAVTCSDLVFRARAISGRRTAPGA